VATVPPVTRTLAKLSQGQVIMVAMSPSGAPLQFVCLTCWYVFNNEALPACEGCGSVAPEHGFPTMPYEFWQYLFVEQLGRGGMGAVFRAYDKRAPERPWVAVKVAQLHGTSADREAKEHAFAREVRAAAALSEYIKYFVGFRAADYNGTPAYLALDFIDWPTLKKLKAQVGTFPPSDVARLGVAILRGIRWMERKNIVHRDLKPENIFARRAPDGSYEAKIADLGVWVDAGATEDSLWNSADVAQVVGSPSYMSPEQSRGGALTTASDVHALGSILFEMATGTVPYPINYSLTLIEAVRERYERMRELPARPANMPENLYWILSSSLSFEPAKRVFTDSNVSHSPDPSIARWMEKALEKFASDYAEQQRQALAAALDRLGVLDRSLTASEAKLTPAILLADSARQMRARISLLRDDTVEANLPGVVTLLSSEVDIIAQEVVQLFEDREIRQALARAEQDLARGDARIQRDIERTEGPTIASSGSTVAPPPKVAIAPPTEPTAGRLRSSLSSAAIASSLVIGLVIGYLAARPRDSSVTFGASTGTAASVASPAPIRPTDALASASMFAPVAQPRAAPSDARAEPDTGIDAGSVPTGAAEVEAGAGLFPPAPPASIDGHPKVGVPGPYDEVLPASPDPYATATARPAATENARDSPVQLAPFSSAVAGAALGALANSAGGCKKEGDAGGRGIAHVTFAPSGRVTSAIIHGDFAGTPMGTCVAQLLQGAKIPAFEGELRSVDASFTVP
jgi:serine/threonine protein kinase